MADPRKVTAMTMRPITDARLETMRSNLSGKWEVEGGGEYVETIRTEQAEIQGQTKTLTYIDWEESDET
jgi:hypothetical protein